ncbi:MAG: hypothetical protein AAGI14_08200 [Pseudomonadota bacterium]
MQKTLITLIASGLTIGIHQAYPVGAEEAEGQETLTGLWAGTLSVEGQRPRLFLNIEDFAESCSIAYESRDEQPYLELAAVEPFCSNAKIEADFAAVSAIMTGSLNNDGRIEAIWKQGGYRLSVEFERFTDPALEIVSSGQDQYLGDFEGILATPNGDLPLVLTLEKTPYRLKAMIESPSQAPDTFFGASDITMSANEISLIVPQIGAIFQGLWNAENRSWSGEFVQGGEALPMTFQASKE